MRVPSPLPVLRAVNQLSLLFEAMLQRSLYSQNYVVIFSFSVHFSEAESIPRAQWEESNTCCDSLSILVQIACLRDFKITPAVPAKKKESVFSFSWCWKRCFVKPLHPFAPCGTAGLSKQELCPFVNIQAMRGKRGYFVLWFTYWAVLGQYMFSKLLRLPFSSHCFLYDGMAIISWGWNCGFIICSMGHLFLKSLGNRWVHGLFL